MPDDSLPATFFRREAAYRRSAPGFDVGVTGCGFLQKPTQEGASRDQSSREYVAVYVLRGTGRYIDWNGQSHPLFPGCVAQRLPGRQHSTVQDADGKWAEVFVVLDPDFFHTLARYGCVDAERPVLHPGLRKSLVNRFEEILRDLQRAPGLGLPHTLLRAHELLSELSARDQARRSPDPHAEMIQKTCDFLSGNLDERLMLPEIAEEFGMSYERLRKVFKEHVGVPPGDYRIRRRIERSCALLVQTGLTVKEVAHELGYVDVYTFSKQFKKVMGRSPDAFRHSIE